MFISSQKAHREMGPSVPQTAYGYAPDLNERGNTEATATAIRDQMSAILRAGPRQIMPGSSDLAVLGYGPGAASSPAPAGRPRAARGGRLPAAPRRVRTGRDYGGELNPSGDPEALRALRQNSAWGPMTNFTNAQLTQMPPMRDPLLVDRSAMAGMHGGALPAKTRVSAGSCVRGGCLECGGMCPMAAKRVRAAR